MNAVVYILSLLGICSVSAYIAPLSDTCKPFVCDPYTNSYPAKWGTGRVGRLLYSSDVVDFSREGTRFVKQAWVSQTAVPVAQGECHASPRGLCVLGDSVAFPTGTPMVSSADGVTASTSGLSLAGFIASDDACASNGDGEGTTYVLNASRIDVTLCSIAKGRYTLSYTQHDNQLTAYYRTFGPMAYTLILILCTVNLTGIVCIHSEYHSAWVLYMATATCSMAITIYYYSVNGIHTSTVGDYAYVIFTMTAGTAYCVTGLVYWALYDGEPGGADSPSDGPTSVLSFRTLIQQGACLHAIDTLGMLIYHTSETPYSGIFLLMLSARTWSHVARSLEGTWRWWSVVDAAVCGTHFALLAEHGVYPQLQVSSTWAAILGTVVFGGYVWVHCDCNALLNVNSVQKQ